MLDDLRRLFWQRAVHDLAVGNAHEGDEALISSVKVGWRMLVVKHPDHDAEKDRDDGHDARVPGAKGLVKAGAIFLFAPQAPAGPSGPLGFRAIARRAFALAGRWSQPGPFQATRPIHPKSTIPAHPLPMLAKGIALLLAILVALWWAGVDFQSVKESVTGIVSDDARTANGRGDDWG